MTMRAKRYQNSAALAYFMRRTTISHFAFLISNFSFKRSFRTQSKDGMPKGLTLNLLFFVAFLHTYMLKLDIIQNYQSMG